VESNESHAQALAREIREELGVEIRVLARAGVSRFSVGSTEYVLVCYWCEITEGEPVAAQHEDLLWVDPEQLLNMDLVPADIAIAQLVAKDDR